MQPIRRNFLVSDLRDAIVDSRIDKTVLVQTVTDYSETPELLTVAQSEQLVGAVVGWLQIDAPDAIARLHQYLDIAQDHPDPNYLAKPETIANVKKLGEFGITFDLLTKTPELPAAIKLVRACPDVQFVMDHISKPYIAKKEIEPWKSLMTELATFPNVLCKVSGLVTEANWNEWQVKDFKPYVEHVIEIFTPQRLMFGSDWPVANLGGTYSQIVELAEALTSGLSPTESEFFWHKTAASAYGIAQ
jgi:L-fuconolactonase